MIEYQSATIRAAVNQFTAWLDRYGETSFDHQSYYAGKFGQAAKALYYRKPILGKFAVAPMVLSEALLPSARKIYWKKQRLPIADAHYAMGFALLAELQEAEKNHTRAVHFLRVLQETRCPGYDNYSWGYPFDWQTRNGTIAEGTPLITTVPYAYEAFSYVHAVDGNSEWRAVLRSIAEHAANDYRDLEVAPDAASCSYTPSVDDRCGVINASAYRAYLLTQAACDFSERRYEQIASRNLNFVLASQNTDGSWYYSIDGVRDFVDHFHTCFVLKALAKIERLTGCPRCGTVIARGVGYYTKNLFDARGLPVPLSKAPRFTVYRRELYDYAECINLGRASGGPLSGARPSGFGCNQRFAQALGRRPTVHSERASFCLGGTAFLCIVGHSPKLFGVSHSCCCNVLRKPPKLIHGRAFGGRSLNRGHSCDAETWSHGQRLSHPQGFRFRVECKDIRTAQGL